MIKLNKILCFILGHKYRLKKKITTNISEVTCLRCKKEFGINYYTKSLLEMDDELRELHSEITKFNSQTILFIANDSPSIIP